MKEKKNPWYLRLGIVLPALLALVFAIALLVPCFINLLVYKQFVFPLNPHDLGWIGFIGSIIGGSVGGIATLTAFTLTIANSKKQFADMEATRLKNERLSIQPFLYTHITDHGVINEENIKAIPEYLIFPERFMFFSINSLNSNSELGYFNFISNNKSEIIKLMETFNHSLLCYLKYEITNIGYGHAIDVSFTVNNSECNDFYFSLLKEKNNVFYFFFYLDDISHYSVNEDGISVHVKFEYFDNRKDAKYSQQDVFTLYGFTEDAIFDGEEHYNAFFQVKRDCSISSPEYQ